MNCTMEQKKKRMFYLMCALIVLVTVFFLSSHGVFAAESGANLLKKLVDMVLKNIIYPLFNITGVILSAYAIGMLVLAFKNGDPDAQARATQALVAAIALLTIRYSIEALKLTSYI